MYTQSSPQKAPNYALYRDVAAADVLPIADRAKGINMDGYEYAHIQVIPAGGADPTAQVQWWSSDGNGKFVQEHTALSKAGVGADTPFEFTVECRGRIMGVFLTTLAAGTAKIYVSGFNRVAQG